MARSSAVKARSQTTNQLRALLVTALEQLRYLTTTALIATWARLRPAGDIADPEHATKTHCAVSLAATSTSARRSARPTPNSACW